MGGRGEEPAERQAPARKSKRDKDETDDEKTSKTGRERGKRGEGTKVRKAAPSSSMAGGSAGVGDPASLGHWAADHLNE